MHKGWILFIIILVLVFSVGGQCSQFEQVNPCDPGSSAFQLISVVGTVKSKVTQVAIGGATVKLTENKSFQTEGEGQFAFSDIEPCRSFTLTAAKDGYSQEIIEITTEPGEDSQVDFELSDIDIPKIIHDPNDVSAKLLTEIKISATINDNEKVAKAKIFYKTSRDESSDNSTNESIPLDVGGDDFTELDMVKTTGDNYSATIPADEVVTASINYYIEAEDASGNIANSGSASNSHSISVGDETRPNVPVIAEEPEYTQGLINTISWDSVSDASEYYVEYDTSDAFPSPIGNSGWISETSYAFNGLENEQIYHYRVKARDKALNVSVPSNVVFSIQDNTLPDSSVNALGAYQATSSFEIGYIATDGLLSGVKHVELYYMKDSGSLTKYGTTYTTSPIGFDSSTTGGNGVYEFHTIATDNVGNVEGVPGNSDASTIIDTTAPPIPTLLSYSPDPTNDNTPTLDWNDVTDASMYHIQVDNDSDFSNPIDVDESNVSDSTYTSSTLMDGTHYWRVSSIDAAGNKSNFSTADSFAVDTAPPSTPNVVGTTPTNNTTPTWTWTSGGGGGNGTYRYKLDDSDLSTGATETAK